MNIIIVAVNLAVIILRKLKTLQSLGTVHSASASSGALFRTCLCNCKRSPDAIVILAPSKPKASDSPQKHALLQKNKRLMKFPTIREIL